MKHYLIFVLLLFSLPLVIAVTIENTKIDINVYNKTIDNETTRIIIEIKNDIYTANNRNFTFTIKNYTGENLNEHFSFDFLFIKNESLDSNIVDKYIICLNEKSTCEIEKGKFDISWNKCVLDLNEYESENATTSTEGLNKCNLLIKEKDLELNTKNEKITNLENEKDDTSNVKWIYGLIAFGVGYLGRMFYKGEIGEKAKEKSMGEFHKGGAG